MKNELSVFFKHFGFNKFIVKYMASKYNCSQINIFFKFIKNNIFTYIHRHFKVIISLPLNDIEKSIKERLK